MVGGWRQVEVGKAKVEENILNHNLISSPNRRPCNITTACLKPCIQDALCNSALCNNVTYECNYLHKH